MALLLTFLPHYVAVDFANVNDAFFFQHIKLLSVLNKDTHDTWNPIWNSRNKTPTYVIDEINVNLPVDGYKQEKIQELLKYK
jgi:hypothetical protein